MSLLPDNFGPQWENQAKRFTVLRSLGVTPRSILDIGAHHGYWAQLAHHIWPESHLFLLEANEDCRSQLEAKGFPFQIELLGSSGKEVDYFRCKEGSSEGNGIYRENSGYQFEAQRRRTRCLDDVLPDGYFDFIKIDCQGAELDILRGGEATLAQAQLVQLETQIQPYNEGAPFVLDVMSQMDKWGFKLLDIIDFHYNRFRLLLQTDLIFARHDSPIFQIKPLA